MDMEAHVFGKKTANSQRPRVDRFVAPRSSVAEMRRRRSLGDIALPPEELCWNKEQVTRRRYITHLEEAFGLQAKFHVNPSINPCKLWYRNRSCIQPWPCVPRKKSYLSSADSVLDLPYYKIAILPELLDWSSDDILVAALGTSYYKWSWHTQQLVSRGITQEQVYTCKFDPSGELLALGTEDRTVEIHQTELSKCLVKSYCNCEKLDSQQCFITALDWSTTGNSFVTGCSRGVLVAHSRDAKVLNSRRISRTAILVVRISPDARYVATSEVAGDFVMVLTWHSLLPYYNLDSDWTVKTLTWHPWRSALLGIGALTPEHHTMVAIWDAPPAKPRQALISPGTCMVDSMLFSHRTGELVLSLWTEDELNVQPENRKGSRIVVFSDPETVVDQWGEGSKYLDRVRTMVFSPDGSKLATATLGEDLIIWNFLPENQRNKHKNVKRNRFSSIPVLLDESLYGFSLR